MVQMGSKLSFSGYAPVRPAYDRTFSKSGVLEGGSNGFEVRPIKFEEVRSSFM